MSGIEFIVYFIGLATIGRWIVKGFNKVKEFLMELVEEWKAS